MKKFLILAITVLVSVVAKAQFEQDKVYIGASVSDMNLSYNKAEKTTFGLNAEAGYFVIDNILLKGNAGLVVNGDYYGDEIKVGGGLRYYIVQNGLYLGATANYIHANKNSKSYMNGNKAYNDFQPEVELGYAFFLSRTVTVEPSLYYRYSAKDSDRSTVGLRVGFGIYL